MNYRKYHLLILLAALLLFFSVSCRKNKCIEGNYDLVSETRSLGPFHGVISEGSFHINIELDTNSEVTIEAESNLLDYITTNIKGTNLIIKVRDNRCIDNNFPIEIKVKTPSVSKLSMEGSGDIYCNGIQTDNLNINISGSGDIDAGANAKNMNANISGSGVITLWGATDESDFSINGSGSIRSYGLVQDSCYATISGSGSMYVFVNDLLDVWISGSGSVYYKGNPYVKANISGSGMIVHQ